jgi:hypothetical protein
VSDIRRENSDSKETSKDTRLSIGAKPVKLTFNRMDQEAHTAEQQKEGSPLANENDGEADRRNEELSIQDYQLSQEKPKKVELVEDNEDGFERPVSKRRKIEKKDAATGQRPGPEMTNGTANLETSSSTIVKKSTSQLFQMPLKSPMRVPNQTQSYPNFGYNPINAPP